MLNCHCLKSNRIGLVHSIVCGIYFLIGCFVVGNGVRNKFIFLNLHKIFKKSFRYTELQPEHKKNSLFKSWFISKYLNFYNITDDYVIDDTQTDQHAKSVCVLKLKQITNKIKKNLYIYIHTTKREWSKIVLLFCAQITWRRRRQTWFVQHCACSKIWVVRKDYSLITQ